MDRGRSADGLHQTQRVHLGGNRGKMGAGCFQQLFGKRCFSPDRRFAVTIENLIRHIRHHLFGGFEYILAETGHGRGLSAEYEQAGRQVSLHLLLKLLSQQRRPVHLAGAIVLYLLVGVGPVQLGNPLAAIDFADHGIGVGAVSSEQKEGTLCRALAGLFDDPGGDGIEIRRFHHLDQGLDRLALTGQTRLLRAAAHLQAGGGHQRAHDPCRGKRAECLPQRLVEDAEALKGSDRDISPLLLDIPQFFAEKTELAIFAPQWNKRIIQKKFDGIANFFRSGRGIHCRMDQAGQVLERHRHIPENLQDGHGFGDVLMDGRIGAADERLLHGLMDRWKRSADILIERIIQGNGGCQPADRLIGHGAFSVPAFHKDILNHLDGRTQANAAGRFRQRSQKMQQNIEVGRQEGVEVDERLFAEVGVVVFGILQFGVVAQPLTLGIEEPAQFVGAGRRFAKKTPRADFPDVAGFQIHLNREAVFQFEKLGGIERSARVVFGQGLLGGYDDPDLAVTDALEVFCQTVQVQDQIVPRSQILPDLVDDKENMLPATFPADHIQHFLDPLDFELEEAVRTRCERCVRGKKGRIHVMGDLRDEAVNGKGVILDVFP